MVRRRGFELTVTVACGLAAVLVFAGGYGWWRWTTEAQKEQLRTGTALWREALDVASRSADLPPFLPPEKSIAEIRREVTALLNDTMDLAQRLNAWQQAIGPERLSAQGLFTSLVKLSGRLASYEELLRQADPAISAMEQARETALDAIRILFYNLVQVQRAADDLRDIEYAANDVMVQATAFADSLITTVIDSTFLPLLLVALGALVLLITMIVHLTSQLRRSGAGQVMRDVRRERISRIEKEERTR